ncbi:aminodeoxychorismate lyase [Gilvimarinus sp. F26214L]|uniref:aminodeoxychorismate lyase n=1 Tax=Gilvimarinus sp. DZF01 TaxID=3461371 RepID=UPI004045E412
MKIPASMSEFEPLSCVNGVLGGEISPFDRGLAYGDGLFETVRLEEGQLPFWREHRQRLLDGCVRLSLALDRERLEADVRRVLELARERALDRGVLKLLVSRGVGGRGYQPAAGSRATIAISVSPPPTQPTASAGDGISVLLCEHRLGSNRRLAGLKHLNRLDQVLASRELIGTECAEGLVFDEDDCLVEGCSRNVFVRAGAQLLTPSLSKAGVAGVLRARVMEDYAARLGIAVQECSIERKALKDADEVFLTNSIRGIWPVRSLQDAHGFMVSMKAPTIAPQLQALFEHDIRTRLHASTS